MDTKSNAAHALEGLALEGGWVVERKLEKSPESTGGHFSVGYIVKNAAGNQAYLKALDYSKAFESEDTPGELAKLGRAYVFERDILKICRNRHLDRIVLAITDGKIKVPGPFPIPAVDYLIFELASCDVRARMEIDKVYEVAWRLRALHHCATGLAQLHRQDIAHQDLKPSNVLVFKGDESKIADLGRATYAGHAAPHDDLDFAGDRGYAPLELLYGHLDPDWKTRRLGCDAYHLGSMTLFLFAGVSMTSGIVAFLQPQHRPDTWGGSYMEVLPYVKDAFDRVITMFRQDIEGSNRTLASELTGIVKELCEPDPSLRGDPVVRKMKFETSLSLQRYVSRFNNLAHKAEVGLL